jgi:hypothetical protein
MKKTLWARLLLCYLVIGVLFFLLLNTYGMDLLEKKLKNDTKDLLIKEANMISSEYIANLAGEKLTLDDLRPQLKSIDNFLNIRVWIVSHDGTIILDSSTAGNAEQKNVNDLDPGFLDTNFSENNYFDGIFTEPMMSLTHSISYNFDVSGYIVLHTSERGIINGTINYSNVVNICF